MYAFNDSKYDTSGTQGELVLGHVWRLLLITLQSITTSTRGTMRLITVHRAQSAA